MSNEDLPLGVYQIGAKYRAVIWEDGKITKRQTFETANEAEHWRQVESCGHKWVGMPENPEAEYCGFIYRITCKETGKMYIGLKQFNYWNGPSGGFKCYDPTDTEWYDPKAWRYGGWKEYISSSKKLSNEILLNGEEAYRFEVLELCRTRLDLHLAEITWLVEENVLDAVDEDGEYLYYNENIGGMEYRPPFKKSQIKEYIEATAEAARNYYLKPNVCCDKIMPFGENTCTWCGRTYE